MQKRVYFSNEGEINPLAIKTFGVSVKDDSGDAIGFFGTGLKMAISVILRSGGKITIWSGEQVYDFSTKTVHIRGADFEIITMNGEELGFTTDNAKTWLMWMAARELICNCLDENGTHSDSPTTLANRKGRTLIRVESDEFHREWSKRGDFLVVERSPIYSDDAIEIYSGANKGLFYRGVRVFQAIKSYAYAYNIKSFIDLTEDRTMKHQAYVHNYVLSKAIVNIEDRSILEKIIRFSQSKVEFDMDFSAAKASPLLKEIVEPYRGKMNREINSSIMEICFPANSEDRYNIEPVKLSRLEARMLEKAKNHLASLGLYDEKYEVRVLDDLGQGVLGLADRMKMVIYLDVSLFKKGTKELASTLYEEYIHLKYNVEDYTRGFQDHVISDLMCAIEEVTGEPL